MAIAEALRRNGHEVLFCCGGTAQDVLEAKDEPVLRVPALRQVMENNEVRLGRTIRENWSTVLHGPSVVRSLAHSFEEHDPDLVITDFEAFSPRAARRIGVPVISLNHQQVLTETNYLLPARYRLASWLTKSVISCIAPRRPEHVLLTSFFFPDLKHPERATLVPPILRSAVRSRTPETRDHVLVYYNQTDGTGHVPQALREVDASFIAYNFDPPDDGHYDNVTFKEPSLEGFLRDLATSRAVICTAGFTLMSEALHLGKPLLVVPNGGVFEQALNALMLWREGLGRAVLGEPLSSQAIRDFLVQAPAYRARLADWRTCGNDDAVACIERFLPDADPAASRSGPAASEMMPVQA
jgi:uncharacterized protein (TIGR00661 family)